MFEQKEPKDFFTFQYHSADGDRNIRHEVSLEEFITWCDVHKHFIDFLSAVYGYDIHGKVNTDE